METGANYQNATEPERGNPAQDLALAVRTKLHTVLRTSRVRSQWGARHAGIGASQLLALNEIGRHPGIRIGELALLHDIRSSTASNLLDKLVQRGWVRRERGDSDQRVVRLFLTDAGEAVREQFPVPASGILGAALSQVPPDALAALDRGLSELIEHLQQQHDTPHHAA